MRYSLKKKIGIIAVVAMMMLTSGCGMIINARNHSRLDVEGAMTPKEILSKKEIDHKRRDQTKWIAEVKKNVEIDPTGLKRVVVNSYLGETYIQPSISDRLEVQFFLLHSEELDEKQKEFWDNTSLDLIEKNGVIYIEPYFPENIYHTAWDRSYRNMLGGDKTVMMVIGIPENIHELGLSNNIGYMDLSDISANIRLSNNVGKIDMDRITPIDSFYISNNVGEVECSIKDLSKVYELINLTNVGEMRFDIEDQVTEYDQIVSSSFGEDHKITSDGSKKSQDLQNLDQMIDKMEKMMDKNVLSNDDTLFEDWEPVDPREKPLFINVSNIGDISVRNIY